MLPSASHASDDVAKAMLVMVADDHVTSSDLHINIG
jgi:hypothetical protein